MKCLGVPELRRYLDGLEMDPGRQDVALGALVLDVVASQRLGQVALGHAEGRRHRLAGERRGVLVGGFDLEFETPTRRREERLVALALGSRPENTRLAPPSNRCGSLFSKP